MKKKGIVLTALLSLTMAATAQKQWTLSECIAYALENNISLKKSKLDLESSTEDLKGAKAALLPTVTASTSQNFGYQPWKESSIVTVTNGQVNTETDKTSYNGSYSVNGQWTVWNGGRNVKNVKINKLTEQEAELSAQESANTIQESIARIYVQILYLDESVRVMQQTLETSKKNEERGREMVAVGKMSKADLAQLSAQRATDEYNIVETQSQLANYKLQLKQLLEITDEQPFDVAIPDIPDERILGDVPALQTVYEQALLTRPEIERQELAAKSSALSVSVAKAAWLPTVNLQGGVTTSTNSLSSNGWSAQMKSNVNASLGVGVSMPLYDGRSTKTQVNKAKIKLLQAQLDLQEKQKSLYASLQGFWLDATTNQQKYKAATSSVESASESYDLLSEQFRLGLKNIVELMTGKDKLLQAQQNRLQSKYQTVYNKQMLEFYQGNEIK